MACVSAYALTIFLDIPVASARRETAFTLSVSLCCIYMHITTVYVDMYNYVLLYQSHTCANARATWNDEILIKYLAYK